MKIKKKLSYSILVVIILISCTQAQQDNNNTLNQHEIQGWLDEYNVPAVGIGIIKDGKLSHCKVFGKSRNGIPANDSTIFTIASITKTITTMVTLKLVDSGQWDLDKPLYKYWIDPDIVGDNRHKNLTTRHVLSHQSGLPNWRSDLDSKKLEFLFEPGTKYSYSGEGFEYLRKSLEHRFHKSLAELSDSILFRPLKMNDSKFCWKESIDDTRFAFRHDGNGVEYRNQGGMKTSAASGLLTTVKDFSKFGLYVINQAGLSTKLYSEMIKTQATIKKNYDQGLGWQIIRNLPNNEYAIFHEGGEWGVSAVAVFLPESKQGIIVFTNSDNGNEIYMKVLQTYLNVGKEIIVVLNGMSYNPEEINIIQVADSILTTYTGSYFIKSFQMSVKITHENGLLKLVSPYSTMVLYAETETKFFLKDDDLKIEFIINENKETIGIMVIYKGAEPEFAKRIE
jgi:CubicO group peptidase (beta-lactamase class C family)